MKYAGLTDDPETRKQAHGNPRDWWQTEFQNKEAARAWEKKAINTPGYKGGTGGEGWKYGYTYTITDSTVE